MILKKVMNQEQLMELLNCNAIEITKLIANSTKKGRWTLLVTLRGEYAIATIKDQYYPKGQGEIKNPHYEFSVTIKKDPLEKLLTNPKWPKVICKKLLAGIAVEIDRVSWY